MTRTRVMAMSDHDLAPDVAPERDPAVQYVTDERGSWVSFPVQQCPMTSPHGPHAWELGRGNWPHCSTWACRGVPRPRLARDARREVLEGATSREVLE